MRLIALGWLSLLDLDIRNVLVLLFLLLRLYLFHSLLV